MRRTPVVLLIVLVLGLTACSEQEPEIVTNEQVPGDQAVAEDTGEGEGEGEGDGGGGAADFASADAVWVADGLAYTEAPGEISGGDLVLGLEILGGLPHNVVFEGFEGDRILVEGPGTGQFAGTASIPAGDYTFYCSISGHRAAGMEGTITVT